VLALGAWTHPAFSATGTDARCDQSLDSPSMSIADNRKLPLQVIDHGATGTAAAGDISFDDTDVDPTTTTPPGPTGARVDIILKQILEEARARQPKLSGPEQTADLSPPLVVDPSKSIEEQAAGLEADPVDSPAALPGFSADELHRYRKQMYRTDI
jgi:hypothetical protein